MKVSSKLVVFVAAIVSSAALSAEQSAPKTQLEMSGIVCKQDQQAAVSAVALRDKGKIKGVEKSKGSGSIYFLNIVPGPFDCYKRFYI